MTPYQQSVEAASKWKAAVEKLWNTQRSILVFGAIGTVSLIAACVLLIVGIVLSADATGMSTALIVSFALFGIAGLAFVVVAYVKQWVFYFDLKRWQESAPVSFSDNIRILAICTLISLIAAVVMGVFQNLSFILFFGFVSSTISFAAFAVEIVKLVMVIKLSGAKDMPFVAKQGLTNIMISYIVYFACAIVGVCVITSAVITGFIESADSYGWDDDHYEHYADDDMLDYDADDIFDYDDVSVGTLLSGIKGTGVTNISDDEIDELFDLFAEAEVAVVLLCIGFVIILCGGVASVVLYYRGWWLISKSELPLLPEPVETQYVEE